LSFVRGGGLLIRRRAFTVQDMVRPTLLSGLALAALSAGCQHPAWAAQANAETDFVQARSAVAAIAAGQVTCSYPGDSVVRFIGESGPSLTSCVQRFAGRSGMTLILSSPGGDAADAIRAAELMAGRDWTVIVRGMCSSSCANYLLPVAARIEVEPYSAVLLHGAPYDEEGVYQWFLPGVLERQRAANPDVSEAMVDQARRFTREQARLLVERHKAFAGRRIVDSGWYDLSAFPQPEGGFGGRTFAIVDPDFLRSSLPNLEIGRFWFPTSAAERDALAEVIEGTRIIYRAGHEPTG